MRLVGSSENSSEVGGFPGKTGGRGINRREAHTKNRGGFGFCGARSLYNFWGPHYEQNTNIAKLILGAKGVIYLEREKKSQ